MNWQEVCADKSLQDLPYKIELNEKGNIEMSPAKNKHSIFQGEIEYFMRKLLETGKAFPECSIETERGVKVADVVWISDTLYQQQKDIDVFTIAPEICVEIVSYSNTNQETAEKRQLYFEKGAKECWICNPNGNMLFYNNTGKIDQSNIIPDFPSLIEI